MIKTAKIFSLLLLLLSINFAQTNKEQPIGSGTEDDPYQISTFGNLSWLTQNYDAWNKYYIQTADIDMSETATWDFDDDNGDGDKYNDPNDLTSDGNNDGWLPVENFSGTYDGGGHKIINLRILKETTNGGGFIKNLNGARVKNLGITNLIIYGSQYLGGLAGTISDGVVSNCYTTGEIYCFGDDKYRFGGIAGYINSGIVEIKDTHSEVNIYGNGKNNYAGGFVGNIKAVAGGSIENCYATGNLDSCGNGVGGFVGKLEDPDFYISNSYSTGNVTAELNEIGGFAGANFDSYISESFATGDVSSKYKKVGGFVGVNTYYKETSGALIENCYSLGNVAREAGDYLNFGGFCGINVGSQIKNCYSIGSVTFQDTLIYDKGFVGSHSSGDTVIASFFDSTVSNQSSSKFAAALNTEEMKNAETYTSAGWDFSNIWEISDDNYPVLRKTVVSVYENEAGKTIASQYQLNQNYPNPFNPATTISFSIPQKNNVKLIVFNLLGQKVASLINAEMPSGYHQVKFDASNLASGVYIYQIIAGDFVSVKKMMLLK